jgi:5-methyltetrahydrofolate--homocysteine methyltransferase
VSRQRDLRERFQAGGLLLDGGMGSMLIGEGLEAGGPPEEWNRSRPDVIKKIHGAYLDAGAMVIETNTFGATPSCLGRHGLGDETAVLNIAALDLARSAVSEHRQTYAGGTEPLVALSVGPCGKMLAPVGEATEAELAGAFGAQLSSMDATRPPDLILIETLFDLREAQVALKVARECTTVPVAVSLTYNRKPRGFFTMMGDEAAAAVRTLEAAGADIVGANCSLEGEDMVALARVLRRGTGLPLLCQPNAGSPALRDGRPVYEQTPDRFAEHAVRLFDMGVQAVGGCCGTTPDFIRALAAGVHR